MNPSPNWLASRSIVAVRPDGLHIQVTLRLGIPSEISSEEWVCAVAMEGLHGRLADIHGIDAWQAFQLAQGLQVQLLRHFIKDGGKLVEPEGLESLGLEDVFPSLRHQ